MNNKKDSINNSIASASGNDDVKASKNNANKESVTLTIKEIRDGKVEKVAEPKRNIFVTIICCLFFPITLIYIGATALMRKIKLPLSVKMVVSFSLVFLIIGIVYVVTVIISLQHSIPLTDDNSELYSKLVDNFIMLGVFAVLLFGAFVGLTASILISPIRKISTGIENVSSSQDLSARLTTFESQDEFKELSKHINKMLANIEESFERQENFVADASHELKTPISVIAGYSNMLDRWGVKNPEILQESIGAIKQECVNMTRIVEQLLMLAKIGQIQMEETEFDLDELLQELVKEYQMINANHTLKYKGAKNLTLKTDKKLILELVRCLVDNAYKYTNAGGDIKITSSYSGGKLKIAVMDNGIGISQADLPHIFDRFYRCDKVRGRESGSSGLGLTIAKSITDSVGGKIVVKSTVNKGSTFTIILN